jgi:hypothetical protein
LNDGCVEARLWLPPIDLITRRQRVKSPPARAFVEPNNPRQRSGVSET